MKRTLIFCYFIFFVVVFIPLVVSNESEPTCPLWLTILFVIPLFLAATSILLYSFPYRPKPFAWFWKIVPFTLIAFVIVSWYWEFILYPELEYPLSDTIMATLFGLATLFPALYLSFKLGYSNLILPEKLRLKFSFKSIAIISAVTILCVATHFIPDTENKINIKVNYVAEYNKIIKPANYDPNDNTAPFYQKAFELCVEQPEQLSKSDRKGWPEDLSSEKQILLQEWVSTNSDALEQLKLGTQRSYYWLEHKGSCMWDVIMPSLAEARRLMYAICSRAKLNATESNFKAAFSDLLVCYQFGKHLTGPKTLVDQLVGIAISSNAAQTGLEILDRTEPPSDLLEDFQTQLELLSDSKTCVIDFTAEKLLFYDNIQRVFTDDGQGGGHIYGTRAGENKTYIKEQLGQDLIKDQMSSLDKLERRQTTELTDKIFEYLSPQAYKTPWQLHNEGQNIQKVLEEMTKDNLLLHFFMPAVHRVLEISYRRKVGTEALITTVGLLRYRADKGELPRNLDQLVATEYLKTVPVDPFSGSPLIYKRLENNFMLYSCGADFDDDGGTPSKWGEGEQGGDQVFWPVGRKQK